MKYNKLSVFLLAIMLMVAPVSAIAELSAHEYKLFSCLYLAGKADKTMTLTDIAAIANHEPIDFVDYSLGASGYLEPMLHIYFTQHILLSFVCEADNDYTLSHYWDKPIRYAELSFANSDWDVVPVIPLCIGRETSTSALPELEKHASDVLKDDLSIQGKMVDTQLSQAEFCYFTWMLAASHLKLDMPIHTYFEALTKNEIIYTLETYEGPGNSNYRLWFSDKLSMKIQGEEKIEKASVCFEYADNAKIYQVELPVDVEMMTEVSLGCIS